MTRYKSYLREKGFKLECDYDYLPYDNGCEGVETHVDLTHNHITVTQVMIFGIFTSTVSTNGTIELLPDGDFEDDNSLLLEQYPSTTEDLDSFDTCCF